MSTRRERRAKAIEGLLKHDHSGIWYYPKPEWAIDRTRVTYLTALIEKEDYSVWHKHPSEMAEFLQKYPDTDIDLAVMTERILAQRIAQESDPSLPAWFRKKLDAAAEIRKQRGAVDPPRVSNQAPAHSGIEHLNEAARARKEEA